MPDYKDNLFWDYLTNRPYPKMRLKDAWGCSIFMVKGLPPDWLSTIDAPLYSNEYGVSSNTLRSMGMEQVFKLNTVREGEEHMRATHKAQKIIYLNDKILLNVMCLSRGDGTKTYIREDVYKLMRDTFINPVFYIDAVSKMVLVKKKGKTVGIAMKMNLKDFDLIDPTEDILLGGKNANRRDK